MERAEELNLSPVHDSAVLGMPPVECYEVVLDNGNTLAVELEVRVWVVGSWSSEAAGRRRRREGRLVKTAP